jgi:rhodanese-related sulfurtransferase
MQQGSVPAELEIDVEEASARLDAGKAHLIDVREEWEYKQRHAPGAVLIPISQFMARFSELPEDKPILVICEHGSRSLSVAEYLRTRDFDDAVSIRGGTSAWARAGKPTEQG